MKQVLLILFFLFTCQNLFCQIKIITEDDYFNKKRSSKNIVDLKIVNNTILVPLELKRGLRVYFILDTGAIHPIITDPLIVNLIDLKYERSIELTGYGIEEPILAHVASGFEYSIGGYDEKFTEKVLYLDESLNIYEKLGEPVYGILGYSFFKNYHVKIDFELERMYLTKPDKKHRYGRRYKCFPLEIIANRPFIRLQTENNNQKNSLKMLIDTGFSGAVNIYPHQNEILEEEQAIIPHYLGVGLNGLVTSTMFKLDELHFNDIFTLKSVTTNLMDSISLVNTNIQNYSDGSIGVETLRRFYVIFDYANGHLVLRKKHSTFNDKFHYNASGIRIQEVYPKDGNRMIILSNIREESNAAIVGLAKKDQIIEIDGKNVRNLEIETIYKRLNNFSEPNRTITVKRNNELKTFQFKINNEVPWN